MLLVVSIHAVCFGRTNHLQAFDYRILKLKMNAYFYICEVSEILQATIIFM